MFDRLVADGDRTTTGGEVMGHSDFYNEDGRMYARKENLATCGNCKGGWPIHGTADDWLDDGFPMVKDLDWVMCPCRKNRVLAAGSKVGYSEDRGKENKGSRPAESRVHLQTRVAFDEQVAVHARGVSLEGYPFVIETEDGKTVCGRVDRSNRLPRISTDTAAHYTVHWGDEALAHGGWK